MYTIHAKKDHRDVLQVAQFAWWLFICATLWGEFHPLLAKEPKLTLNTITDAWKRSQLQLRSGKFTWTERIIVPKGTIEVFNEGGLRTDPSQRLEARIRKLPLEDQTLEGETILAIDGDKWRYTTHTYVVDDETGKLKPQKSDVVWNNGVIKAYMPPASYDHPIGNISRGDQSDFPRIITARPMFLISRSIRVGLLSAENLTLADRSGRIDDHPCCILESGPVASRRSIWADLNRDYCILRETSNNNGQISVKMDITYTHDAQHGWVPSGWRIDEFKDDGTLRQSALATVTHWQINAPLDPKEFELEFPSGTWVRDFTQRSDLGDSKQYIVRENGDKRIINAADRNATYQQLLETETGHANLPSRSGWRRWSLIALSSIVFISCAIILLFKRRLAKRKMGS